jgi:hypothetical protein
MRVAHARAPSHKERAASVPTLRSPRPPQDCGPHRPNRLSCGRRPLGQKAYMGGHSHCRPIACVRAPYEPNQPQSYSRIGQKLYAAFDAKDRLLGRFKTRKDAYAAISNESCAATRSAPFAKEGQRAVLCIVAGEIKHRGLCDLPIDKIAALAGVCRTTVQTTIHEARRLGHIKITERPIPGRKHLPNVVEIASAEWRAWIIILGDY